MQQNRKEAEMIEIKWHLNELYFYFDKQDANDFLKNLKELAEKNQAAFDASDEMQKEMIRVFLFKEDKEKVEVAKNSIQMWLTNDAIEYAEFKMQEYIRLGYFSPAEYCEFLSIINPSKKKNMLAYFMTKAP